MFSVVSLSKHFFFLLSVFSVKPDPPESVLVNEVEGFPNRLIISWNFPSSWALRDAFPLVFHIRYRPHGSQYWSEVRKGGGEGGHVC